MSPRSKSRTKKQGQSGPRAKPAKRKTPPKRKAPSKKAKKTRALPAKKPAKKPSKAQPKRTKVGLRAGRIKPGGAAGKGQVKAKAAASKAKAAASKAKAAASKAKLQKLQAAERAKEGKARDAARKLAQKAKEQQQQKRAREVADKAKVREREKKERERDAERVAKEKAREAARQVKEREALKVRQAKEREAERVAKEKGREAERERIRREREDDRVRKVAEREAEREAIRKLKDEERAKRDAEREVYRRAKEAERERIRAEKEAARRTLEGKVARASKRAARDLSRGANSRVYRPDAIPNQAGTTRRLDTPSGQQKLVGVRSLEPGQIPPEPEPARPSPPPPTPVAPTLPTEERYAKILARLNAAEADFRRDYRESFDMSWVYHDSALEGVVYTYQELRTATDPSATIVPDSGMQPVCEEIRRHRQAIEYVRELAERKRIPINVDTIKKLYVILHPDEGDVKSVKYRKDIPQHRLYFHEYAAPDKIAYRVRQVIDWLNGPEPKKLKSPIRIASRVHYDLVRVFPFPNDSGKVARLLMNALLMRAGYPPAIIHSTERQRYYEALKGQLPIVLQMASDSINNALLSIEKKFDEYDAARPSSAPLPLDPEPVTSPVASPRASHDLDYLGDLDDAGEADSVDDGDSDDDSGGGDD